MEFKMGDRVKIRPDLAEDVEYGTVFCTQEMLKWAGKIVTIDKKIKHFYTIVEDGGKWWYSHEMFVKNYTWEDFLKCPIGTKITFESGKHLFKADRDIDGDELANTTDIYSYEELEGFEINYSSYGKIIKIEEPTYTTVYEPTEQVEEMTMEEVCKALGKQIKIVKEK